MEQLIRTTSNPVLRIKLFQLRDEAYKTEFVSPHLMLVYEQAKEEVNGGYSTRPQAIGGSRTLH